MKNFDLDHKAISEFELRNLLIASLQNKISKAKSSYGEDEPAKKEKENLRYNRQSS